MDSQKLSELADKFWNGECSEQEERDLKNCITHGEILGGLEGLAEYFQFTDQERSAKNLDDTFDATILHHIENTPPKIEKFFMLKLAAGILIIVGIGFSMKAYFEANNAIETNEFVDTFDNSEVAYREVKKALSIMSSSMSSGMVYTGRMSAFHKAQKELKNKRNKKML